MTKSYYKKGSWNVMCEVCNQVIKSSEVKRTWEGFLTCQGCWDPKHPSLLPQPKTSDPKPLPKDWHRPERTDTFV